MKVADVLTVLKRGSIFAHTLSFIEDIIHKIWLKGGIKYDNSIKLGSGTSCKKRNMMI